MRCLSFYTICTLTLAMQPAMAESDIFTFFRNWTEFNKQNCNLLFRKQQDDREIIISNINRTTSPVSTTKLSDIQGSLPQEIYDLCDFINDSQDFVNAGATPPKGILLEGPPGTGKTSIARALAGELGIPFISVSASSFMEIYVGTGPKSVRELFNKALSALDQTQASHVIIFIDELDAIGSRTQLHSHSEAKNTINELLVQMDGFSSDPRIIIIAATNNVDDIDEALKRRGRFDYIVRIPLPDTESRFKILYYYLKHPRFHRSVTADVDIHYFAQKTAGFSGADLEGLAKDAAINAGRNKRIAICQEDLEKALLQARRMRG